MTIGSLIILLLAIAAALLLVYLVGGACFIAYVATHPPRKRLKHTPAEFGAAYEDVTFNSRDGVPLSGWFIPGTTAGEDEMWGAVILCHGMSANREEMLSWASALWERGLAILLFDFRGLGRSGGDRCTAGYTETRDLQGAVDYLASRPDLTGWPIGVFGFSMGGATAIMAAADDPRIDAVATHGAFASLDSAIRQRCRHHYGPVLGPVVEPILLGFARRLNWYPVAPSEVTPVSAVSRLAPRPLLILHGGKDKIIRPSDARALHAAAGEPKSLRMLPGSGHRRIHRNLVGPVERRVAQFFCTTLTRARRRNNPSLPPDLDKRRGDRPPHPRIERTRSSSRSRRTAS